MANFEAFHWNFLTSTNSEIGSLRPGNVHGPKNIPDNRCARLACIFSPITIHYIQVSRHCCKCTLPSLGINHFKWHAAILCGKKRQTARVRRLFFLLKLIAPHFYKYFMTVILS